MNHLPATADLPQLPLPLPTPPQPTSELRLTIAAPLPSWNAICGMGHWQRAKLKASIAASFLSALRASAADCSTRTTCAKNTWSTAADMLASYQEMTQAKRTLSRHKKKLAAKKTSGRKWSSRG